MRVHAHFEYFQCLNTRKGVRVLSDSQCRWRVYLIKPFYKHFIQQFQIQIKQKGADQKVETAILILILIVLQQTINKMNRIQKVHSNSSTGNDQNDLCSDMDWMQLRSQTDVTPEDCKNKIDELKPDLQSRQGGKKGDQQDELVEDFKKLTVTSAIFRPSRQQNDETPLCFESQTLNEVGKGERIVLEAEQQVVERNPEHKMTRMLNQFDDIEDTSSTTFKLSNNENKILIKGIISRDSGEIKESMEMESTFGRKIDRQCFKPMNGADIVRERSRNKNPRPTSGNPFKSII